MKIEEVRIYSAILEQGLDIKKYLDKINILNGIPVKNIYANKAKKEITDDDSIVDRIRYSKDADIMLTVISGVNEFPILIIEYSTAVPVDDHKMQRSDNYFWGGVYRVPVMKISARLKGMSRPFGGGNKISDALEQYIAWKNKAVFYPVCWENEEGKEYLATQSDALSCIKYTRKIQDVLIYLFTVFSESNNISKAYETIFQKYTSDIAEIKDKYEKSDPCSVIVNSKRFRWDKQNLSIKLNRFGHAMDPDRGVLFFANMILCADSCAAEFQINRSKDINARGGYRSLFDGIPKETEMLALVEKNITDNDNIMSPEFALKIFLCSLNLEKLMSPVLSGAGSYYINDEELKKFLYHSTSMAVKSLFFLTSKILLTNLKRKTICAINWNTAITEEYLKNLSKTNNKITEIKQLSFADAKEDIITFTCLDIYRKMKCEILAVSYPGSQGDRCILIGSGRKIKRIYVDVIAYKNDSTPKIFLQESKTKLSMSVADVKKLVKIRNDVQIKARLKILCDKFVGSASDENIYCAIAGKKSDKPPVYDVDYYVMIDVTEENEKTILHWQVALINMSLVEDFRILANSCNKLAGYIELDKIYKIC